MRSLTYIEIDIPVCKRTYGIAPCTASIPATGAAKCFNTWKVCQDKEHYSEASVTLRFARPTDYLPRDIDAVPSIAEVSFTPATISLGENLGQRATLSVTFTDHRDADTGAGQDKYVAERPYDPFQRGTYWGKFRARQPFLQGLPIRWITGLLGQSLAEMDTRHFVIESFDGPTPEGKYTLIAKDILKLLDGDRAQVPLMSGGYLVADITNVATAATLSPVGIGNAEYPLSGTVVIGGNEACTFTRAGDVLTLTARGQLNTLAAAHRVQDRVQIVRTYANLDPAEIIQDLMVNYGGVDPDTINLVEWKTETAQYLNRVYSANICEPTSVATLIVEIIQQACLSIWWDEVARKIRLRVLRKIATDVATFTPDDTIQGSLKIKEQPDKRLSQVWTYFGQINPTKNLSDVDNFRSVSVVIDEDAEDDYGAAVIKKINSRWIPALGRAVADRVGAIQIGRYRDPPRQLTFDLPRYVTAGAVLGNGYRLKTWSLQDESGAPASVPLQATRINPQPDRYKVEAEEMLFEVAPEDLSHRLVIVDANSYNVNLRTSHDMLYPLPVGGITVTLRINEGVVLGSTVAASPALDIGAWPAGVTIVVDVIGRLQGAGGQPGAGRGATVTQSPNGERGGVALYTRYAVDLRVRAGARLWGGGGGGGGGAGGNDYVQGGRGGGGAGVLAAQAATDAVGESGAPPTQAGKSAASGGRGGDAGNAGANGGSGPLQSGGIGGGAGPSIDGVSYVTVSVNLGDRRGPQIN